MISNEELKRVHDMFTDCWRFYKKYADVKDDDEYWKMAVSESSSVSGRYNDNKFVRDLLLAVIAEIERKAKELRNNADTTV